MRYKGDANVLRRCEFYAGANVVVFFTDEKTHEMTRVVWFNVGPSCPAGTLANDKKVLERNGKKLQSILEADIAQNMDDPEEAIKAIKAHIYAKDSLANKNEISITEWKGTFKSTKEVQKIEKMKEEQEKEKRKKEMENKGKP